MARIANISLQALGQVIFSASGGGAKSAEEIFRTDYKEFHIAGHNLAVSQVTCMDSDQLLQRKGEFLQLMSSLQKKQGFDMVILMITDVLLEGTQLLFVGDRDSIRQAFNVEDAAGRLCFLGNLLPLKHFPEILYKFTIDFACLKQYGVKVQRPVGRRELFHGFVCSSVPHCGGVLSILWLPGPLCGPILS